MNVTRSDSMSSSACSGSHLAMNTVRNGTTPGSVIAVEQARDVRARRGHQHAVVGARSCTPAISVALYASVAWVWSTPLGAPLDPEVNSTAASCSRSVQQLGDRCARRAARRDRRRTVGVDRASSMPLDVGRAGLVVERRRDRAESPARAVQHRDLVAVRRLPRDRVARRARPRPQPAGDARDRVVRARAARRGQQLVERRPVPRAARRRYSSASGVRKVGVEHTAQRGGASSRRWPASRRAARSCR